MTVSIRPYQVQDLNSVLELANSNAAFDGKTSEADFAITNQFPNGFWVAEDGGKIVGFIYGYFKAVPEEVLQRWKSKKVGYVELMAVSPDNRRQGIGRSLMAQLLREFKKAGADMVLLDCPSEAVEAKRLYDKMGFEDRFYGMKKRI